MGLLVRVIRWAPALAGLGVTVALIPLSAAVGRTLAAVRRELVGYTDARVKLCTEVITGAWMAQWPATACAFRCPAPRPAAAAGGVQGREAHRCTQLAVRACWPCRVVGSKQPCWASHARTPPSTPAGVKAIKLYAWEQPYVERISRLR